MKTIPMIFNQEMVNSLVDGRKTVTRRPMKPEIKDHNFGCFLKAFEVAGEVNNFDYENSAFKPGDLIWVRESFKAELNAFNDLNGDYLLIYIADDGCNLINPNNENNDKLANLVNKKGLTPSIHMPRWASRLTLRVTAVRCERVQNIDKEQAEKEGVRPTGCTKGFWVKAYQMLWDSIYSNWDLNPWVWVVEFEVIHKNIDKVIKENENV